MSEENKKKGKIDPNKEQKKKVKKIKPKDQQEQEELFAKSDAISPANKKVDFGEIELNSGETINVDDYIREHFTGKATHFFQNFYFLIADLAGIPRKAMLQFVKPLIVPMLKHFLLYGRFPNAVQERLYARNKYTGKYYARKNWNYQWLTKEADVKFRNFITQFEEEAERVLAAGGNIKTFIVAYCTKYGLPIQLEMFDKK